MPIGSRIASTIVAGLHTLSGSIREAIEEAKICVPFVRSDENLADFFTKPLKPQRFFELRDKIMNVKEPSSQSDGK